MPHHTAALSRSVAVVLCATSLAIALTGCATQRRANPALPLTVEQARAELAAMDADPRRPVRPVVVAAGFMDPGLSAWETVRTLRRYTSDDAPIRAVSFVTCCTLEACRDELIACVDAFPFLDAPTPGEGPDAVWTRGVDVVGVSMGGLVAVTAAAPPVGGPSTGKSARRLRVRQLFTLASPLTGARRAEIAPAVAPLIRQMRAGSDFRHALAARRASDDAPGYTLRAYVCLGDWIVGPEHAAPAGQTPYWLDNPWGLRSHARVRSDPRVLADVARRLRGEPGYFTDPPAPLPTE